MTKLPLAILLLVPFAAQGGEKRVLGSASYTVVCSKMAEAGITTRTQSTRKTDSLTDNVLVVVGADGLNRSGESRQVSNTEIFVGANITGVSTHTSSSNNSSATQADLCRYVVEAKTPEDPFPAPKEEPISSSSVSGR